MKLQTLFIAAATLLVAGLLMLPQPADARRMGGGGNVGRQYSVPSQAPVQRPTQAQGPTTAAPRAPQAGGASRWLGPLAGLAAGGLLASLFMGGGFQGFQIMDFLVIAALGFGVFMLWRWFRRNQARPLGAAAYARTATANGGPAFSPPPAGQDPLGAQDSGGGLGEARAQTGGGNEFPVWFDGAAFVAGAKDHYIRLQAAWDKADFSEIRDYTTPELCAELQRERAALVGPQYTEVVSLQAQLASMQRDGDLAVASILFSGLIREDQQAPAQEFREFWHVRHQWASAAGDWYIAGIQQA